MSETDYITLEKVYGAINALPLEENSELQNIKQDLCSLSIWQHRDLKRAEYDIGLILNNNKEYIIASRNGICQWYKKVKRTAKTSDIIIINKLGGIFNDESYLNQCYKVDNIFDFGDGNVPVLLGSDKEYGQGCGLMYVLQKDQYIVLEKCDITY